MTIIELLTDLANCLPVDNQISEKIQNQSAIVKNAIMNNDNELLGSVISNKKFFATEVKVTIY